VRSRIATAFVLTVSLWMCPANAGASVTLTLDPAHQMVDLGGTARVTIGISGLGLMDSPALSMFTIALAFDPTILSVNGVVFGDPVASMDYLAPSGPTGSQTTAGVTAPGTLALSELSLELPAALVNAQPDAFGLATVTFDAVGLGTSPLISGGVLLVDELGGPLWPDPLFISGSVTVQAVPVPGAAVLGLVGIVFTARLRRSHFL